MLPGHDSGHTKANDCMCPKNRPNPHSVQVCDPPGQLSIHTDNKVGCEIKTVLSTLSNKASNTSFSRQKFLLLEIALTCQSVFLLNEHA